MSTKDIAEAIKTHAVHVKYLGVGAAASTMGAIDFLAVKVAEAGSWVEDAEHEIARVIDQLAEAHGDFAERFEKAFGEVAEAFGEVADAIDRLGNRNREESEK
jgi:hypothetical protein